MIQVNPIKNPRFSDSVIIGIVPVRGLSFICPELLLSSTRGQGISKGYTVSLRIKRGLNL